MEETWPATPRRVSRSIDGAVATRSATVASWGMSSLRAGLARVASCRRARRIVFLSFARGAAHFVSRAPPVLWEELEHAGRGGCGLRWSQRAIDGLPVVVLESAVSPEFVFSLNEEHAPFCIEAFAG